MTIYKHPLCRYYSYEQVEYESDENEDDDDSGSSFCFDDANNRLSNLIKEFGGNLRFLTL